MNNNKIETYVLLKSTVMQPSINLKMFKDVVDILTLNAIEDACANSQLFKNWFDSFTLLDAKLKPFKSKKKRYCNKKKSL